MAGPDVRAEEPRPDLQPAGLGVKRGVWPCYWRMAMGQKRLVLLAMWIHLRACRKVLGRSRNLQVREMVVTNLFDSRAG